MLKSNTQFHKSKNENLDANFPLCLIGSDKENSLEILNGLKDKFNGKAIKWVFDRLISSRFNSTLRKFDKGSLLENAFSPGWLLYSYNKNIDF